MGLWGASKAQASSVQIGKVFLDGIIRSGTRVEGVFTSPYHIAFLFRYLCYLTGGQLGQPPDSKDIQQGTAVGFDRLRGLYFGKPTDLTRTAQATAVSDGAEATRARNDVDRLVAAASGDVGSKASIKALIEKHPFFGDPKARLEMSVGGLDVNDATSIALSILFIEPLDR